MIKFLPLIFVLTGCYTDNQVIYTTPTCEQRNAYVDCLHYFLVEVLPDENYNPDGSIRSLVDTMRYCSDLNGYPVNLEHKTVSLSCDDEGFQLR